MMSSIVPATKENLLEVFYGVYRKDAKQVRACRLARGLHLHCACLDAYLARAQLMRSLALDLGEQVACQACGLLPGGTGARATWGWMSEDGPACR